MAKKTPSSGKYSIFFLGGVGGVRGRGDGGRLFWFEWTGEWGGVGLSAY